MDFKKGKVSEVLDGGLGEGPNHVRRPLYSALWQADGKKTRRFAPADFIGRYMEGFFDYAIADEVHELKGDTVIVAETGALRAENNTWTSLGPEGTIAALAVDTNNLSTLYAGTKGGTVYKSTDGGKNWTATDLVSSYNVSALVIDPQDSSTIYAGTGRGVFRSRDGGQNWMLVNSGLTYPTVKALAIDPANSSVLYAGTWGEGVFKNTRREVRWTQTNTGLKRPFIYELAVDSKRPSFVYAGTPNGVLKSTDEGTTWTAVTPDQRPPIFPLWWLIRMTQTNCMRQPTNGSHKRDTPVACSRARTAEKVGSRLVPACRKSNRGLWPFTQTSRTRCTQVLRPAFSKAPTVAQPGRR